MLTFWDMPEPSPSPRRAAVYLRVSTDRQTAENQVAEVRQLAVARGYEPVVYEEIESAAKVRPVLDRMLADLRAGRVQAVAVWALDRLHRSMTGAINTVLELDRLGVPVLSVREPWLDTSGPVRPSSWEATLPLGAFSPGSSPKVSSPPAQLPCQPCSWALPRL